MNLNPKRSTFDKLKELYEAQYGHMPNILRPMLYYVIVQGVIPAERTTKTKIMLQYLKEQGYDGKHEILDNGNLLILTHFCRLENLQDEFDTFIFLPVSIIDEDLTIDSIF